jgi:hypothetical protein
VDSIDQVGNIFQWSPFATRRGTLECHERIGTDDRGFSERMEEVTRYVVSWGGVVGLAT